MSPASPPPQKPDRRDRLIEPFDVDPYHAREKPKGAATCSECGVVFRNGRWTAPAAGAAADADRPAAEETVVCPACRRVQDAYPAGWVTLSGAFVAGRRDELIGLMRNEEAMERGEHPLNRIMAIEETEDALTVTTTDVHLPQRIARAVERAYGGELEIKSEPDEHRVRASWRRDD
ncbi:MAG: BCAM0308 family protein [Alphaproteobacteria bacterium]|nr:BCAM0308 family protein [Alphaproteobacteria bacterium]